MAKDLMSPHETQAQADEALDQMFGYYARETRRPAVANDPSNRVISELDAAAAILAARRAA